MKSTKKLLLNTAVLTGMNFLMRTVSVAFNVYLTNRIGAAGIGLFQLIMTVYALSVTLGCAGIRLASTRLVAEDKGLGQGRSRVIMRRCLLFGFATGLAASCLLYGGAELAAGYWLHDLRAVRPLRILSLSLTPVALSASLSGYFTAVGKVPRFAAVNLLEQGVKIAVVVTALSRLQKQSLEGAVACIVFGMTAAEFVSLALGFCLFRFTLRGDKGMVHAGERSAAFAQLLRIALPDVIGSSLRSVLLTVEHLLIPVGFQKSGSSAQASLASYGTIHGMALPLLLYPSAILTSLSGLLVPELAQLRTQKHTQRIASVTTRVVRMALWFSLGTAGIIYAFAGQLSAAVYGDDGCAVYLRILAPLLPVMYLDMTVDGILKGLDQQLQSMRYNIYDSALCVVLVCVLLPRFGVRGYIWVLFAGEICNFYLSIRRLMQISQLRLPVYDGIVKPLLCILAAFCTVRILPIFHAAATPLQLIGTILLTIALYFLFLRMVGSVTRQDMRWIKSAVRG